VTVFRDGCCHFRRSKNWRCQAAISPKPGLLRRTCNPSVELLKSKTKGNNIIKYHELEKIINEDWPLIMIIIIIIIIILMATTIFKVLSSMVPAIYESSLEIH